MLHHDRNVGPDDAGIVRIQWDRLRVIKVIEPQTSSPPRVQADGIGADRLAIREVEDDLHISLATLAYPFISRGPPAHNMV